MAWAIVAAVAAPIVVGGVTAAIQKGKAKKAEEKAENAQRVIDDIERDRAPVYDASGKIRDMKDSIDDLKEGVDDMKSLVTNPYANLGVATEAAEIQMEQTDIALANTLDTIAATGAGAGGATALAQAALQSKRGVAADIQRQEVQNQQLRAQGEQQKNQQLLGLEQQKLSLEGKKIDIEGQAISAEERAAAGEDARVQMKLDRAYGEKDFFTSRGLSMRDAATNSLMGGFSAGASVFGSAVGSGVVGGGGGGSSTPSYGNNVNYFSNYNAPYMSNPNPVQTYTVPSYSNPSATSGVDITGGQTAVDLSGSDRRLKRDYKIIGKSKSGLNIYEFSYIHKPGRYTGVMSDEISKEAVVVDENGYDMVDYSKIDVDFKKL